VKVLDARNLLCPLPVICVQNQMSQLQAGDILLVECTDPGVLYDIPAWCKLNGHRVQSIERQGRLITLTLEHGT